jgi:N-acetyltransferase
MVLRLPPRAPLLSGGQTELVPLALEHVPELTAVGLEEELWLWTPVQVRTPAAMHRYVADALDQQRRGGAIPFAIRLRSSARLIGSTRYLAIEAEHGRVEIGSTWIAPAWQRTMVNTETKYLLLEYAFESLGATRVELKTDALNARSRRAILRLGATEEGVLRRHVVTWSGRVRDTVYYSILDSEWPVVKERLGSFIRGTEPLTASHPRSPR